MSRSGRNSDSDFLMPAWNFANNIAAIVNYSKVIGFFQLNCPPGIKGMGGQNSDSDFLVPAWNFANNIAAIANYPKVIAFFLLKCPPGMKNMLFSSKLKQK